MVAGLGSWPKPRPGAAFCPRLVRASRSRRTARPGGRAAAPGDHIGLAPTATSNIARPRHAAAAAERMVPSGGQARGREIVVPPPCLMPRIPLALSPLGRCLYGVPPPAPASREVPPRAIGEGRALAVRVDRADRHRPRREPVVILRFPALNPQRFLLGWGQYGLQRSSFATCVARPARRSCSEPGW